MSLLPFTTMMDHALAGLLSDLEAPRRRWRVEHPAMDLAADEVKMDAKGFQVCVDVGSFAPSELEVVFEEPQLVIRGTHQQKTEHGEVKRHFERRYLMPENFDDSQLKCSLSEAGQLRIEAPVRQSQLPVSRSIPIEAPAKE